MTKKQKIKDFLSIALIVLSFGLLLKNVTELEVKTNKYKEIEKHILMLDINYGLEQVKSCSGTVVAYDVLLTSTHCFDGETINYIEINGVKVKPIDVISDGNDNSLIKIDHQFPVENIAKINITGAEVGNDVRIIGYPNSMKMVYRKGYIVNLLIDKDLNRSFFMDMNTYSGDSGSGIFNDRNEVIGVMSYVIQTNPLIGVYYKLSGGKVLEFSKEQFEEFGVEVKE